MQNDYIKDYAIDYIEIYTPMAKSLAYWHTQALGFLNTAYTGWETGNPGMSSYVLESSSIRLVLTSAYPTAQNVPGNDVLSFIAQHYCGVKRLALRTTDVKALFEKSIRNGAIPVKFPVVTEDKFGYIEEAAIKLYDHAEIVFINREGYTGAFRPGYNARPAALDPPSRLTTVDHIASEVRINEISYWTNYLTAAIGTELVQRIERNEDNKTGMIMNINQSKDKKLTLVMAEPESYRHTSKVQQNIDNFGPGIHHIAFAANDLFAAIDEFEARGVEFVKFPSTYYDLLRVNEDFKDFDIDKLQRSGILADKEGDTYLLQKFIKPISDRPFFLYELVQRVNGYNGFALKNINVLKKAEEIEIMKTN
jgi:4-hydroxyphenylpyruvate dioxygenase